MPIKIAVVRIAGFRGLENIEVNLEKTTVLFGVNNAGKTSFLKALQLAFGDSRFLNDDDFHIDANERRADDILIDVLMVPTGPGDKRTAEFDRMWGGVFRRDIQTDQSEQEFVAFRSKISRNDDQKRFFPSRTYLKEWPKYDRWQQEGTLGKDRVSNLSEYLPFLFQDAQRDITEDSKLRSSFLGRVLSKVEYDDDEVKALKELIDELNRAAVEKSDVLKALQDHLSELGDAIGSREGKTEISPFAKEVRDLTKGMRLNYQEGENSFSMEYHGMGTRSWASLLALKSFAKILETESVREKKAFLPILALEEPEAHLHPNAQKQIYRQMIDFPGQVIISTHSPYIAAQANLGELRSFYRNGANPSVNSFPQDLHPDEARKIKREVVERQGEFLFAKVLVLQEGQTEAQMISQMIEAYLGVPPAEVGITFVQVGGYANYTSFLKAAKALRIPVIVFSDTDNQVVRDVVENAVNGVFGSLSGAAHATIFLDNGNDIEKQLIQERFREEVIESLVRYKTQANPDSRYESSLRTEYNNKSEADLLKEMHDNKTTYSHLLGEVFIDNPKNREQDQRFPESIVSLCEKIKEWVIEV